jgi:glycosyltransferase involved in cell wall biosynthesis
MTQEPLVSVVTPAFNAARYLEENLASVAGQSYPRLEHIVVDGGSADGTVEILERHTEVRWMSEPDSGQSDALNKGLGLAGGEVIGWLNADDFYLPGAVASAVRELAADPAAGVVYGNALLVDHAGKELSTIRSEPFDLERALGFGNVVPQPAAFIRRAVLDEVGGLTIGYHYAMDFDLWLRIAKVAPLKYIDQEWAAFRIHRASKTGSALKAMWHEERAVARAHGGRLFSPMFRRHLRDNYRPRALASRLVRSVGRS